MLKKTALSLFGLAVMLVCFNPPKANAGVIVALGPVYPRVQFMSVLTGMWRRHLLSRIGQIPTPTGLCSCAQVGDIAQGSTGMDIGFREDMNTVNSLGVARTGGGNKFQAT